MADKAKDRRQPGHNLEVSGPGQIRNVVLIGPGGSGKTTLIETLLVASGAISRAGSVRDGSTVCDFEEAEAAHQRSISLAIAPVVRAGIKINLIDTPGYADFVGELRAGLRAADCALFVVAANESVDAATRALWRECAEVDLPRVVVITKLDQARADYDGVLLAAQNAFGDKVLPLYLPVRSGGEVTALAGLLSPTEHTDDQQRGSLIEAIIEESEDETLMDRYLSGEEIAEDVLVTDLEQAVAKATFFPVVPVCSVTGVGCAELLDLAVRAFPAPPEHRPPDVFSPSVPARSPPRPSPATPRPRWWQRS
jgi:elongation factor G